VPRELTRVALLFPPDARFVSGVGAAAEHIGERVNLGPAEVLALSQAAQHACQSTFSLLKDDSATLRVVIEQFSDRVEISIEHQGEALPTAGLDTFLDAAAGDAGAGQFSGILLMSLVDRVKYKTVGGTQRMTLVKNAPGSSPDK